MQRELVERREETFDLLISKGMPYRQVVERLAREYDVTQSAIKTDIGRMNDWLPKLVEEEDVTRKDGLVRLKELRQNRQELHKLALKARQNSDPMEELQIRRKIDDNLELDVALSQSLGHSQREPTPMENAMEDFATGAMRVEFEGGDEDETDADEQEA